MESTALFLFKQFSACHLSNPPLRRYRSSVSPLYFALQNTGEKCTMYPYTETETPLSILSPCVSVREYRGSVRRTRGLKKTLSKKFLVIFLNPSPQKLTFLRSLPYILHCKTQGRRCNTNTGYSFLPLPYPVALRGTAHKIEAEAKEKYISTSPLSVPRSIVGHSNGGGFN